MSILSARTLYWPAARKLQIPSTKLQGSFNHQASNGGMHWQRAILVIGAWLFFGAWSLGFGASAGEEFVSTR
jgi:hypothetical protein